MNLPLSKNFQAKWLQRDNEDFISIVEAEYNFHSDKPFWKSRPTRLFAIKLSPDTIDIYQKEYDRLENVFNSNYYKKECLNNIFCDDDVVLKLIEEPRKLLPGIVFPAVNEYESDINFPLVSFSKYDIRSVLEAIDDMGTKEIDKFKDSCNHIFEIIYNFTSIEYRKRGMYFLPQLAYFQMIKGDSYQLSLVMQIWYEWNKNSFQKYDMPSICATGRVSDNGEVLPIDKADIKLEAAYNMGFDYILFPKGNEEELFEQLKSLQNKDKVLFFNNIKDVFEWLNLLSDKNRNIRAVKLWAEEERVKPDSEKFEDYFRNSDNENPIEWKKIIKGDFEEKLEKLRIFTEEYCEYKNIKDKDPFSQPDGCQLPQLLGGASNETNIAIDFFIKNKDNFFTQNVDIAKVWVEYLWIATPLSEARNDDYINLIEITNIIRTSTEPQVNYNSDIEDSQQFLYEFIRTFCFGKDINSLFQPVVWKSKDYRNLFTNLAIQTLSSNKELLKRYLIEIVSDVDNLILGFYVLSQ